MFSVNGEFPLQYPLNIPYVRGFFKNQFVVSGSVFYIRISVNGLRSFKQGVLIEVRTSYRVAGPAFRLRVYSLTTMQFVLWSIRLHLKSVR